MKIISIFVMMLVLSSGVFAYLGHAYSEEMQAGKVGEIVLTFYNSNNYKEKLRINAYIPALDVRYEDSIRVRSKDSGRAHVFFDIPDDAAPDYYPVIITITDDEGNRMKRHSWVLVE
jgi:hypothetical protein